MNPLKVRRSLNVRHYDVELDDKWYEAVIGMKIPWSTLMHDRAFADQVIKECMKVEQDTTIPNATRLRFSIFRQHIERFSAEAE